ncbi:MAG TPA: hypothetical protein VH350_18015 [Candidatus Sulfotelmatobacter sp.]|jgi:hypothetical protein|nr:hypothetical protein [Candidatus Sulfotelmatobacter sp.]
MLTLHIVEVHGVGDSIEINAEKDPGGTLVFDPGWEAHLGRYF